MSVILNSKMADRINIYYSVKIKSVSSVDEINDQMHCLRLDQKHSNIDCHSYFLVRNVGAVVCFTI